MTHLWKVHVKNLKSHIGVGIHDHEKNKQRILVNVVVEGHYPELPKHINDCFDYDHIHELVVNEWPKKAHKPLLENCVIELLEYIFRSDERVERASVRVCKPDIFPNAESVGVECQWTREDFQRIYG
jgi:FolB domain-containing protein